MPNIETSESSDSITTLRDSLYGSIQSYGVLCAHEIRVNLVNSIASDLDVLLDISTMNPRLVKQIFSKNDLVDLNYQIGCCNIDMLFHSDVKQNDLTKVINTIGLNCYTQREEG